MKNISSKTDEIFFINILKEQIKQRMWKNKN